MSKPKKNSRKVESALAHRWPSVEASSSSESSNEGYSMDIDDKKLRFNEKLFPY